MFAEHYDVVFDHYKAAFEGLEHIVLHEFESEGPPIHIHVVSPPDAPFRVLLTEGMSVMQMRSPAMNKRFMELSILIPKDIHFIAETLLEDHPQRWIIDMLRYIAKFPHIHSTFLDAGHSIQADNDDNITWGKGCPFNSAMLLPSATLWDALTLFPSTHGDIRILSVMPLHQEELIFRMQNGLNAFMDKVVEAQVTELLDLNRPSFIQD